ncbi:MAG: type 1 glutamine amidotransferase domain-containing protein [Hyphomicrobiales bacterium]|nr:type 1 glutamine amidotransferase domain-containing protein [Hyphomicrobiales bacterium]
MAQLSGKTIAILSTNGFEQSELEKPLAWLRKEGATVHVIAPEAGEIKGWDDKDWGASVPVDKVLSDAVVTDYDALVLPGGQMNPDILRANPDAVAFVRDFYNDGKTIAAICHAPWLLIEAGVLKGKNATSYKSIKTDVINAGAEWRDEAVVTDEGVITSRQPDDIPAFCEKIAEEILEGEHSRTPIA